MATNLFSVKILIYLVYPNFYESFFIGREIPILLFSYFTLFLQEMVSGLSGSNVPYIHNKFLLIDPLSDYPIVVTGSANFSQPSTDKNDENMVYIPGDKRVADIYLGEFFRMFDHFYSRYITSLYGDEADTDKHRFLKSKAEQWIPPYYREGTDKYKKRELFSAGF